MLGTLVTHLGARLDAHLFVAALISVAVIALGFRIMPGRVDWPELVPPTEALRALWILQLLLALGAYVARFHAAEIPLGPALALAFPVSHRLMGGSADREPGPHSTGLPAHWLARGEAARETLSPEAVA
jgi:hypothetical protein